MIETLEKYLDHISSLDDKILDTIKNRNSFRTFREYSYSIQSLLDKKRALQQEYMNNALLTIKRKEVGCVKRA